MNAWSHLPNAQLIDWVIRTLGSHPKVWYAAADFAGAAASLAAGRMDAKPKTVAAELWYEAWYVTLRARDTVWDAVWDAARDAAWDAVLDAADEMGKGGHGRSIYGTGRGSILALIVYDDCNQYLQMTYEQLKIYAILSEKPQAVLLLPMKYVMENSNECLVTSY